MTKLLKMFNGKKIELTDYGNMVYVVVSENTKEKGYSYATFSFGGVDTNQPMWGGSLITIAVGDNAGDCLRVAIETGLAYKGVTVI